MACSRWRPPSRTVRAASVTEGSGARPRRPHPRKHVPARAARGALPDRSGRPLTKPSCPRNSPADGVGRGLPNLFASPHGVKPVTSHSPSRPRVRYGQPPKKSQGTRPPPYNAPAAVRAPGARMGEDRNRERRERAGASSALCAPAGGAVAAREAAISARGAPTALRLFPVAGIHSLTTGEGR